MTDTTDLADTEQRIIRHLTLALDTIMTAVNELQTIVAHNTAVTEALQAKLKTAIETLESQTAALEAATTQNEAALTAATETLTANTTALETGSSTLDDAIKAAANSQGAPTPPSTSAFDHNTSSATQSSS